MNRRIFLYGFLNYPRGSAPANYVQYLSQALKKAGYDVYIITNINEEVSFQQKEGHLSYKDTKIIPFNMSKNKVLHYLEFNYLKGYTLVNILKGYNLSEKDIVLLYSSDLYIHREILKYRRKINFKTVSCVAEWFPDSFFKSKKKKKQYNSYFENILPKHDLIFPISTYIEEYLIAKRCKTMRLPIMADVDEYPSGVKSFNKIKFIFPGNGLMKDAIESVLKSFSQLNVKEKERVELHLSGVKEAEIRNLLTVQEYDNLKSILVIHKWMSYEELIKLYQTVHFLILSREKNQMTLANFPSKVPEVMSYGVIPIVSRVGDYTKYYLENDINSLIFDGCSTEVCLEQIRKALSMNEEEIFRLSIQARECVKNKFDYRNWVEKIYQAIESI